MHVYYHGRCVVALFEVDFLLFDQRADHGPGDELGVHAVEVRSSSGMLRDL